MPESRAPRIVRAVASAVIMMIGARRQFMSERRSARAKDSPSRPPPVRSVKTMPGSCSAAAIRARFSSDWTTMSRAPNPFMISVSRRAA